MAEIQDALEAVLGRPGSVAFSVNEKLPVALPTAEAQASLFPPAGEAVLSSSAKTSAVAPRGLPVSPSLTFETFVEGSSNRLAFTAAQAVSERPSQAYNPLIIYG